MATGTTELVPNININNNYNNTINNVNKQKFNINIFLNEQCKDALTVNEFIDKIRVTLDNLITTKNKGLCEGVSDIFIENMNKLSLYERPIHCTDQKRETVYIKCCQGNGGNELNNSGWEKDVEKQKLKQTIKKISHIQQKNLDMWRKKHPNWMNDSNEQEEYMLLIKNSTESLDNNNTENKVIKNVCKNTYIIKGDTPPLTTS